MNNNFSNKNKVVQSNDLIQQANWKLNTIPLKIFKAFVACIDTKNPPKDNCIVISKNDMFKLLGSESDGSYSYLKKQVKLLQSAVVEIKLNKGTMTANLIPTVYWDDAADSIKVKFSEDIMPFLIDLKERFTQYPIFNIKLLNSKYSLILYEYLLSRERSERNEFNEYDILIDDLRYLTATTDKYSKFKDFETYVLKPAVNNINEANLEFLVKYDKLKKGTKIKYISFKLRKRTSYKEKEYYSIVNKEFLNQCI